MFEFIIGPFGVYLRIDISGAFPEHVAVIGILEEIHILLRSEEV